MIIGKVTTSLWNTQPGSSNRSASRLEEERLKAVQELEEVDKDPPHEIVFINIQTYLWRLRRLDKKHWKWSKTVNWKDHLPGSLLHCCKIFQRDVFWNEMAITQDFLSGSKNLSFFLESYLFSHLKTSMFLKFACVCVCLVFLHRIKKHKMKQKGLKWMKKGKKNK